MSSASPDRGGALATRVTALRDLVREHKRAIRRHRAALARATIDLQALETTCARLGTALAHVPPAATLGRHPQPPGAEGGPLQGPIDVPAAARGGRAAPGSHDLHQPAPRPD